MQHITQSLAHFRATLFADWIGHYKTPSPMSQETIAQITGISPRRQRHYGELTGIERQRNIAVAAPYTRMQEAAWCHPGAFEFKDYQGKQGPRGRHYVAWPLPNTTTYPSRRLVGKRQQRAINRRLVDLKLNRAWGNGRRRDRLFYWSAKAAASVCSRTSEQDIYWLMKQAVTGTGLWAVQPQTG